jgi:hypothetical protein
LVQTLLFLGSFPTDASRFSKHNASVVELSSTAAICEQMEAIARLRSNIHLTAAPDERSQWRCMGYLLPLNF